MHVIVTGGSSGIGLAVARAYALQGAAVSLVVGLLAGFVPAWQAARTQIVSALRQA